MEFTAEVKPLVNAFGFAAMAVESKRENQHPLERSVLLDCSGDHMAWAGVCAVASLTVRAEFSGTLTSTGSAVLEREPVSRFLASLPAHGRLHVKSSGDLLHMSSGSFSWKPRVVDAAYPKVRRVTRDDAHEWDSPTLSALLKKAVSSCAARDGSFAHSVHGVLIDGDQKGAWAVGTDGVRMAVAKGAPSGQFEPCVVPRRAVDVLRKFLEAREAPCYLKQRDDMLGVCFDPVNGRTSVLTGAMKRQIRWREILAIGGSVYRCRVSTDEFANVVARSQLISGKFGIKLRLRDGSILVEADQPSVGCSKEEMDVEQEEFTEEHVVGVNPKFLADALGAMHGEKVTLEWGQNFRLVDEEGATWIIMPMELGW